MLRIMKRPLAISTLLVLAACATPEQIAERQRMQALQDDETCKNYGLRPGSEAFGNCRLQIDLARQQQYYYYNTPPYHYGPRFNTGIYYVR